MCVGFLPLSCAVPVSGYSCLPFSDIGQEIVARGLAREPRGGRRGSRVISDFDFGHFSFSPLGSDPKRQPTDAGEGDAV